MTVNDSLPRPLTNFVRLLNELLERIPNPVHLLSAQYNLGWALQERDVYRAVSPMSHSTYAIVNGAGHDIHLDQPEAFVREVSQFLFSIRQEVK